VIRNTISVSLLALSMGAAALSAQTTPQTPPQAPAPPVVTPAPAASAADKPLVPLAAAQSGVAHGLMQTGWNRCFSRQQTR